MKKYTIRVIISKNNDVKTMEVTPTEYHNILKSYETSFSYGRNHVVTSFGKFQKTHEVIQSGKNELTYNIEITSQDKKKLDEKVTRNMSKK